MQHSKCRGDGEGMRSETGGGGARPSTGSICASQAGGLGWVFNVVGSSGQIGSRGMCVPFGAEKITLVV